MTEELVGRRKRGWKQHAVGWRDVAFPDLLRLDPKLRGLISFGAYAVAQPEWERFVPCRSKSHNHPSINSMIVGLSLLLVFASFIAYRHPPASWTLPWIVKRPIAGGSSDREVKRHEPSAKKEIATPQIQLEEEGERTSGIVKLPVSPEGTPKATAASPKASIPSFTLDNHDSSSDDEAHMPPPSFPALNSAQRASGPSQRLPSFSAPRVVPSPDAVLMPPPRLPLPRNAVASGSRQPPTSSTSALRVPSTGPLPNRGPTNLVPPPNSLAAPITSATSIPNPRKKITLGPGYSPLNWAELTRTSSNLSGVDKLMRVTPSLLKQMNGRKGKPAWSIYQGRVYNITPYLPYHPGGEGELRRAAGKDGSKLFAEVHPWVNWEGMLAACVVGIMVGEGEGDAAPSPLDEMD